MREKTIEACEEAVCSGGQLSRDGLLRLAQAPLEPLMAAADEVRKRCCGDAFHICSVQNAKSGLCSEDCAYCAQSAHWDAGLDACSGCILGLGETLADRVASQVPRSCALGRTAPYPATCSLRPAAR